MVRGDLPSIQRHDFSTVPTDAAPKTESARPFYDQDPQAQIVSVDVNATDAYAVRDQAISLIRKTLAFRKIYKQSKSEYVIHPVILVEQPDHEHRLVVEKSFRPPYTRDARRPDEKFEGLLALLDAIDPAEQDYLAASIQYFRLALLASTNEAAIVNLWIALEALFQEGSGAIISRIAKHVPIVHTSVYTRAMLRSLSVDLKDIWRTRGSHDLLGQLSRSSQYVLDTRDLLDILLDRENGVLIKGFHDFLPDNPLIHHRIYRLRRDMLDSPETLRNRLEQHRRNIDWQVRRIYRLRNSIMHQAKSDVGSQQLLHHLHSYYLTTLHELLHILQAHPSWSLSMAFDHRAYCYEYFISLLKGYKDASVTRDLVYYMDPRRDDPASLPAW